MEICDGWLILKVFRELPQNERYVEVFTRLKIGTKDQQTDPFGIGVFIEKREHNSGVVISKVVSCRKNNTNYFNLLFLIQMLINRSFKTKFKKAFTI